jgi:hypothetical protein
VTSEDEIRHLRELVDVRFDAQKEAVELAMVRLNERLGEMNELREQITRERGIYLTRERYDAEHQLLAQRVSALELQNSKWSGSIWMLGAAISALVIIVNVALKIWIK